jgi:ribokinase
MRGANLRGCIVTRGAAGCRIVAPEGSWQIPAFPVDAVDPTGAGDAFAAGVAYGLARHWDWPSIGRFANAVGGLATRSLGAQSSLPTLTEVESLLAATEIQPIVE